MRESKKLDERFRVYMYLPNISIRSAVKREVVAPLVQACYLNQDISGQDWPWRKFSVEESRYEMLSVK